MRWKILILQLVVPVIGLFSQTITYKELSFKKPNAQYQKYVSQSGATYSVGDKITIASPSLGSGKFAHVKRANAEGEITAALSDVSGYTGTIIRIRLVGSSKTPTTATLVVQGPKSTYGYIVYIEKALEKKEVKPKE